MPKWAMHTFILLGLLPFTTVAQQSLKVRRADNRFLFFQTGQPSDTIARQRSNVFRIHFPDSIQHQLMVRLENGQLVKQAGDSLFRVVYIPGMKYSLTKPDTAYISLLEGVCEPSGTIRIKVENTATQTVLIKNTFFVK